MQLVGEGPLELVHGVCTWMMVIMNESPDWSIAGHAAAAAYVLQGVWRQWLEKSGLSEADCPVPNLSNRNSQIVGQGVVTT